MTILEWLFILGITVEAMSGALAAGSKNLDFFGVIIIACVTGLGGGTVRDVLINSHHVTWIAHPHYLIITACAAIVTIILVNYMHKFHKAFLILDAIGLAAFTVIGTEKGLALGFPPLIVVILAMVTGICGGMLRDILCDNVPLVLKKELYALVAIFGSVMYQLLAHFEVAILYDEIMTLMAAFALRMWAIYGHVELPKFTYHH